MYWLISLLLSKSKWLLGVLKFVGLESSVSRCSLDLRLDELSRVCLCPDLGPIEILASREMFLELFRDVMLLMFLIDFELLRE